MENTVPAPGLLVPGLRAVSPCSLAGGDAQAAPVQSPAERRLLEGSSVTMTCQLSSENTVHWYRQLPGEPPKRILYMSGSSPTFDDNNDRRKFQIVRAWERAVVNFPSSLKAVQQAEKHTSISWRLSFGRRHTR
uniref:Immunoglobulin V-set domain-containing protein n=1 Tax=Meleagris gallopavo TaxID=9103 RepID=A0A803XPP3_MELGA